MPRTPRHTSHTMLSAVSCVAVQLLSCVQLLVIPWTAARQAPLSSAISWSLLQFMSIHESVMLSNHPLHPLWPLLPSVFPSIWSFPLSQLFTSVAKVWSFRPMTIQGCYPVGLTGLISVEECYTWGCEYANMALTGVWLLVSSVALRALGSFISWPFVCDRSLCFPLCTSQFVEHDFSLYCFEMTCIKFYFHLLFWALGWYFQTINAFCSGKFPCVSLFIISFPLLSLLSFPGISVFQSLTYRIGRINYVCLFSFLYFCHTGGL